jgi:hypothetical protein
MLCDQKSGAADRGPDLGLVEAGPHTRGKRWSSSCRLRIRQIRGIMAQTPQAIYTGVTMSTLADRDLERLTLLLERGKMKHAVEIARLVRTERSADQPETPAPDPLSRRLNDFMLSWAGKF